MQTSSPKRAGVSTGSVEKEMESREGDISKVFSVSEF
jgi:hypothetical protein